MIILCAVKNYNFSCSLLMILSMHGIYAWYLCILAVMGNKGPIFAPPVIHKGL